MYSFFKTHFSFPLLLSRPSNPTPSRSYPYSNRPLWVRALLTSMKKYYARKGLILVRLVFVFWPRQGWKCCRRFLTRNVENCSHTGNIVAAQDPFAQISWLIYEEAFGTKRSSAGKLDSCVLTMACLVLSCFFRVHPWRAFSGACRSRPTLYRAEHHTPLGRVIRSYALEPSRGLCGSYTCMPVLDPTCEGPTNRLACPWLKSSSRSTLLPLNNNSNSSSRFWRFKGLRYFVHWLRQHFGRYLVAQYACFLKGKEPIQMSPPEIKRKGTNSNVAPQKTKKCFVPWEETIISSPSFFHYRPFQHPLTPTARSGCGLYSLVYLYFR
jgi:hypothetical protein